MKAWTAALSHCCGQCACVCAAALLVKGPIDCNRQFILFSAASCAAGRLRLTHTLAFVRTPLLTCMFVSGSDWMHV
jgi:hypothetical protein